MDDIRFKSKDSEMKTSKDWKAMLEEDDLNDKNESGKLRKLFSKIKSKNLQKELKVEFDYSSDDDESEDTSKHHIESYPNTAHKSRELYAKYVTGYIYLKTNNVKYCIFYYEFYCEIFL